MVFGEGSYSSIMETKEVQRLVMKVDSVNVCLLSFQFFYTYETCKHCASVSECSGRPVFIFLSKKIGLGDDKTSC